MNQFTHDTYNASTPEHQTRPSNIEIRVNIVDVAVRNASDILGHFLVNSKTVDSTTMPQESASDYTPINHSSVYQQHSRG
jgi:hypothetical protein